MPGLLAWNGGRGLMVCEGQDEELVVEVGLFFVSAIFFPFPRGRSSGRRLNITDGILGSVALFVTLSVCLFSQPFYLWERSVFPPFCLPRISPSDSALI